MNELISALKKRLPKSVLFHHANGHFTYQDFFSILEDSSEILEYLKGKNVVIKGESRLNCAILSLILNDSVGCVLFLPKDIPESLHSLYLNQASIDYEVSLIDYKLTYCAVSKSETKSAVRNDKAETTWIIPTSGTTSTPKLIQHSFTGLTKTTKRNVSIGEGYIWGLVYDIYRFAGMQVFLQAVLGGSRLVISESNDSISQLISLLRLYKCNALSATPSFWRKILMHPDVIDLDFKIITLGGEIVDDLILSQLKNFFPKAKIIHIYASTEVGVGFSVHDGMAGFPLSYLKDSSLGLTIDKNNILCISNSEYGNISTGDIVKVGNERVYFLGRETGTINVGGNKVIPEEVENCILELKYIHAVRVYAKKSSFLGNLVCADIVISENYQDSQDLDYLKNQILTYCQSRLSAFKVPAKISFVSSIELTASGKVKR